MKDGKNAAIMVGVGACGSTITELAQTIGLARGFILNSAPEDLSAIKGIEPGNKWKLAGIGGAAKDRAKARDAFKNDYPKFLNAFKTRLADTDGGRLVGIDDADFIFVAASAGGGTGSGILPVLSRMLQVAFPNVQIVPIVVWPATSERGIAQQNCIDCTRELLAGSGAKFPVILVDNTRINDDMILGRYDKINRETIENIKALMNSDKVSRISNIDTADRQSMFHDPGLLVIGSAEVDPTKPDAIIEGIHAAIDKTPVTADIAGITKKVAIQCECNPELYTSKLKDDISAMFPNAMGFFDGYYGPDQEVGSADAKVTNHVLIAFSGASLNEKAFQERVHTAEEAFKAAAARELNLGKGNTALKSAWSNKPAEVTKVSSDEATKSMDSIFDEVENA